MARSVREAGLPWYAASGLHQQSIMNPMSTESGFFGLVLAADGDDLLAGAPFEGLFGATAGGLTHHLDASTGALLATFTNPTPSFFDVFGSAVGVSSSHAAVGAYLDDTATTDGGSVYLFQRPSGLLLHSVSNPGPSDSHRFGSAVAVDGPRVLAAAPQDDVPFLIDASTGMTLQTFFAPTVGVSTNPSLGTALSFPGNDRAAIGEPLADAGMVSRAGLVHVFDLATGTLLMTLSSSCG
jgi:hypothetical protein